MHFLVVAFLLGLGMNAGMGKTYPWSLLPGEMGYFVWITFSLGFVCVIVSNELQKKIWGWIRGMTQSKTWLILILLGNLFYILLTWYYFRRFGYSFPWIHCLLVGISCFFIRGSNLILSAGLSVGLLIASILHFPLNYHRSDMLPAIELTLNQWAKGQGIYHLVSFPDATILAHYLPGTLFSHLPAWKFGMDFRWNQVLWRLLWIIPLLRTLSKHKNKAEDHSFLHFVFLNPYFNSRHELYFEFFIFTLVSFWVFERWKWIFLSLAIWTRQWAWVLTPFLILYDLKVERSLKPAVLFMLSLAGISLLFLGVLVDFSDIQRFSEAHKLLDSFNRKGYYVGDYGLTFAPAEFWAGLSNQIPLFQALICILLFGIAILNRRLNSYPLAGLALCLVIMTNALFENYFWISPFIWLSCGVIRFPEKFLEI